MRRKHMKKRTDDSRAGGYARGRGRLLGDGSRGLAGPSPGVCRAGPQSKIDHVTAGPAPAHPRGGYHRGDHHGGHSGRYYGGHDGRHHGGYYGGYRHYRPYDSGYPTPMVLTMATTPTTPTGADPGTDNGTYGRTARPRWRGLGPCLRYW